MAWPCLLEVLPMNQILNIAPWILGLFVVIVVTLLLIIPIKIHAASSQHRNKESQ